ncbi:MAG: hypothetical protein DDT28_00457 [Dehalococcoidia bacterium]|nr:hypothetical protein [Chloroflexota bacterium]
MSGEPIPDHPPATIGFAVRCRYRYPLKPEKRGYTVTGHLGFAGENPTPIDMQIYQPRIPPWWWPWRYRAGRVADVASRNGFADVARVGFDNVIYRIHTGSGVQRPVRAWVERVRTNTQVFMSGRTSGLVTGKIINNKLCVPSCAFGTLRDQMLATYPSADGDSGAPVYKNFGPDGRWLAAIGVHWGSLYLGNVRLGALISPMMGVHHELYPYRVYTMFCS